tara:strand:- start:209 stop:571 length:363 start_codon:yes stop_codon:yes gene_type:complete
MPPKKPQPPKKPRTSASSTRKINVKPMKVGTRGAVYTVTRTGARRYRKRVGKVKLPRLKLTSSQKRRQKAILKEISPLNKKKLTKKSNLPKRERSRSRSRSSSKTNSSSPLSSLSSLLSN